MRTFIGSAAFFFLGLCAVSPSLSGPEIDFNRDVRPILSRHCFKCHGPDDQARTAGLRLDRREAAVKPGPTGRRAIVPGKPEQSELVRRIFLTTAAGLMPPPHANRPLSDEQKKTLKAWIAAGAEYQPHWAFVAPKRPPRPPVKNRGWVRNPIDTFVLARLEAAGLQPSPEADRYTLARRVHLDLIGIPPTPEEADAFVNDASPDAYERLVDRLLASPHYGERWARRWLDLARYADTNGYEKDRPRSIWPYRDWVIRALNADMPFDSFTIHQLAGDMLPPQSGGDLDRLVATGFHRNTMLNEEGGIDPLEFRFHAMTDRVSTTATTWLGLTVGCAQCHTHKFDPITHLEYYQFMAFLNNADEPAIDLPDPKIAAQRQESEAKIAALEAELPGRFPPMGDLGPRAHLERRFDEWLEREAARAVHWTVLRPVEAKANLPLLTVLDDGSVLASGDQSKRDVYDLRFKTDLKGITALRIEALPDEGLPKHGPGRVYYEGPHGDFFLSELALAGGGKPTRLAKAAHSFASDKNHAAAAIDGDPQTGWSINGGQGQPHTAIFQLAEPLADAGDLALTLLFERYYAAGLGRFRVSVTTDRCAAETALSPAVEALLLIPAAERQSEQRDRLLRFYLQVAPELAEARQAIRKLRDTLPAFPTTLVMAERPPQNPRPTHLHRRGEFLQAADPAEPGVPAFLHPLPEGAPRNRLTFARWLVDPRNPLVGRVTVNRQWAAFFGRGLVPTLEDFGYQGQPPSHPELLDWLAVDFVAGEVGSGSDGVVESGRSGPQHANTPLIHPAATPRPSAWSLKRLHRLIVTSATYRQASRVTPELLRRDPQNRLLARGPRVRLEAEMIRDAALKIGGLLSPKIGGPSVFPPQPPGITSEGTYGPLEWKVSEGEDRYRRGLYTFSKRTAPYAQFATFDGPSGEACVARREVSNSPLQALTLLHDAVFIEAAQALGRMLAAGAGTVEERAAYLFRRVLTRPPAAEEQDLLLRFYRAQKQRLEKKELDATAIAGAGEGDPAERAAWTLAARSLLNLDEVITRG